MTDLYKNTILTKLETINIAKLLKLNESVTTTWLPGSGRTYLGHALQNPYFMNEVFSDKELDSLITVYIDQDVNFNFIETHILGKLTQYGSFSIVSEALFALVKQGKRIIFIVDNFRLDREFFSYLNTLRNVSIDQISFLFMVLQSDFEHLKKEYPDSSSLIYHNIIPIGYFSPSQSIQWANHTIKKLELRIGDETVRRMVKFTGGIPLLIDNYIRFYRNYRSHEKVIDSQEMRVLILKLMGLFTKFERMVLEKLLKENSKFTDAENVVVEYFAMLGLIDDDNSFRGKWVKKYFNSSKKKPISVQNNQIYINDVDLTYKFTSKEVVALQLISSKNIVDKDEIHSIISPESDFSNWAVDKFISRLRAKLKEVGLSKNVIITLRGKGYKMRS